MALEALICNNSVFFELHRSKEDTLKFTEMGRTFNWPCCNAEMAEWMLEQNSKAFKKSWIIKKGRKKWRLKRILTIAGKGFTILSIPKTIIPLQKHTI